MRTTRMGLFALALGGGVGAGIVWFDRTQFVFAVIVVSLAAMLWGYAARKPRVGLWTPAGGRGTLIFDVKPRDRSGIGCGRCGAAGFYSHRCTDGSIRPGAFDHLADSTPMAIILPEPDSVDVHHRSTPLWSDADTAAAAIERRAANWPFMIGAPE